MCYCSVLKQADAANLSESIHAVLELVDNVVSSNAKLKNQLIYTIKRKPPKKSGTTKPRKSPTENSAKDPAKNPATENSAKDPAKDTATEISAKDAATNNSAADKLAARKLGDSVEEVDIADTRISKIFKCDPRHISANLLLDDKCKEWLQKPSTFLKFDQTPLDRFTNNPQHSAIISIRKLEEQDTHSRILRRLYCIVFSRFRELDSTEDAGAIAKALYKYYYPGQSLCENNLKQLTTRIRNIENAGKRYDHLSRELCAGAIVILGDDVSNSTWERWLPKEGERFDQAKNYLITNGIITQGNAFNEFVKSVIELITEKLRKSRCTFIQNQPTNSKCGANPRTSNKRPRPTKSSDKADSGTKKIRCSSSAKIIPEVQDDGVATSDKHKTSGICLVSTEMGSNSDETLGVQMILKAAGHIEEESNVASQNQIQISSTPSDHFTDCFSGGNISHRLPEVDGDGRSHEPCLGPEINVENWDCLVLDSELSNGNWMPLSDPELNSETWVPELSNGNWMPDPELNGGNWVPEISNGNWMPLPDPELSSGNVMPLPDPELNGGNWVPELSNGNWMLDAELGGGNWVPEISNGNWMPLPDPELSSGNVMPLPDPELYGGNWVPELSNGNWMPDPELNGGNWVPEISNGNWMPLPDPEVSSGNVMPLPDLELNGGNWVPELSNGNWMPLFDPELSSGNVNPALNNKNWVAEPQEALFSKVASLPGRQEIII